MVRCFFLLIHFLVVEEYELSRSARHILSVALTLECVRVLCWSISFSSTLTVSLVIFCVRLLSELMHLIWTHHHVTNHLTSPNKLIQHMSCNLILKIWKCNTRNIWKCNFAFSTLIFGKWFYICKLIHIDLKPTILIASFLLALLLNN